MTGRHLYDKYVDSLKATKGRRWIPYKSEWDDDWAYENGHPYAWPFLTETQRRFWNDMARRLTPKRRTK